MSQHFDPGDFLLFQLESGYGLLRFLAVEDGDEKVWHVAAIEDLFLDADMADAALRNHTALKVSHPHIAMSDRAFLSTQVAKMSSEPLSESDLAGLEEWKADPEPKVSDRSIRLLLGLR